MGDTGNLHGRLESAASEEGEDSDLLYEAAAEIARLRTLMRVMSKNRCSHIIQRLGATVTYTCGIHNLDMSPHGGRCPECDSTPDNSG